MTQYSVVPVNFLRQGMEVTIHPVVSADEKDMVMIDCGYPDFLPRIRQAAEERGLDISRLTAIIITHHDYDHMGALAQFKRTYPGIQVISSVEEADYISGKKKSLRLQQAEALQERLPEAEKAGGLAFQNTLRAMEPVPVDMPVTGGTVFPWCGGIEIVAMPGHMPGHIGVYLREKKVFVAGDSMMVDGEGELAHPNPQYTLDMEKARQSVGRLLVYDIEEIVCYHGGVFRGNIPEGLTRISRNG